jgi:DNA-binding MarR family transcriptional regulator
VSNEAVVSESGSAEQAVEKRLGYLLKHAWLRHTEVVEAALKPYGIDGREWAVLLRLADGEPVSQQQLATRVGIDRTTMVAFVDALERKGLVERHPHPADRRKNVVALTPTGHDTLEQATREADAAERAFLAPLSDRDARQLKESLRRLFP